MDEFIINVQEIEELQTIKSIAALDNIFTKAKRTITGGMPVWLVRGNSKEKFDELTTEEQLAEYKAGVYKYL
ncbi:MAG TPA: hypothetical protein VM935_12645 [Chitinophagaceae bacterium]|nr:hypothetical protein [Chitinophagaceae bacterium]